MLIVFVITLLLAERHSESYGSGFDAYSSCYRTSRQQKHLPCDFSKQNWCSSPGSTYPWQAVRRFVHENQGLMKRMYGEERHISVLKAEIDNNEIQYFYDVKDKDEARQRYSKTFASTLLTGQKTSKSVKTKKAISSLGNINSLGKTNYFGGTKKITGDLSKSTPLLTLKPETTQETSPPTASITTEPSTTTTSPTTTKNKTSSVTSSSPPTLQIEEQSHANVDTTLQPNDTQTITETDFPIPTTDVMPDVESTTEEDGDVGEETSYAEQESYDDSVEEEEGEDEEEELGDADSATSKSPPILRLKGINACPVKEEVVAPFWANNTRGEVLALLNLYPFEQYVHWEKCSYEHKQMFCREGCRCEQQYRLHRLLAYDPNNECRGIFSDWFRFPSCCVCKCYDVPMELRLTSRSPRSSKRANVQPQLPES